MASISDTDYPDGVYPPSDDTFLLVDAVSADLRAKPSAKSKLISNALPLDGGEVRSVLEIGSGSGFVIASASVLLPGALAIATDVSVRACRATQRTLANHKSRSRSAVVQSESLGGLREGLRFDVVLVNPPYVPTPTEELWDSLKLLRVSGGGREGAPGETETAAFTLTWAGGRDGAEMTRVMLRAGLRRLESETAEGRLYVIVVEENNPEDLAAFALREWDEIRAERGGACAGLEWTIAVQTRANNELLSVMRFVVVVGGGGGGGGGKGAEGDEEGCNPR